MTEGQVKVAERDYGSSVVGSPTPSNKEELMVREEWEVSTVARAVKTDAFYWRLTSLGRKPTRSLAYSLANLARLGRGCRGPSLGTDG